MVASTCFSRVGGDNAPRHTRRHYTHSPLLLAAHRLTRLPRAWPTAVQPVPTHIAHAVVPAPSTGATRDTAGIATPVSPAAPDQVHAVTPVVTVHRSRRRSRTRHGSYGRHGRHSHASAPRWITQPTAITRPHATSHHSPSRPHVAHPAHLASRSPALWVCVPSCVCWHSRRPGASAHLPSSLDTRHSPRPYTPSLAC